MYYWHLNNNNSNNNDDDNAIISWENLAPIKAGRRLGQGPWGAEGGIVLSPGNSDDQV